MKRESERERRRKALEAVVARERTQADVAREFGVSRQAVHQWLKSFEETGRVAKIRGRSGAWFRELDAAGEAELREIVQNKRPSDFDIESEDNRWHWIELHDLVERLHRRRLPRAVCMKLLGSFGVSDPDISIERKRALRHHDHFDPNPVSSEESDELRTLLEAAKARLAEQAPPATAAPPRGRAAAKKPSPRARARAKQKRKRQRKQRKRNR